MTPFFFGERDDQLFGAYHPPKGSERSAGVLLCSPAPQESMQSHFALRRLAVLLSGAGFHVLRFDYYGTGDSSGDIENASVAKWSENVKRAAEELAELATVRKVSIVGYRLGAALAADAIAKGLAVQDFVLWEPVVRGRAYMDDLYDAQKLKLAYRLYTTKMENELLGFAMTPGMRREIEAIDLMDRVPWTAARSAIFHGWDDADMAALAKKAEEKGSKIEMHLVKNEGIEDRADKEMALLSTQILNAMTAHLARKS